MMNEAIIKKLEELESNAECQQKLADAGSPEQLCEILKEYGLELTVSEAMELIQKEEAELSADDLDQVAGGVRLPRFRGYKIVRIPWPPFIIFVPIFY